MRSLGLEPKTNFEALDTSYEFINNFIIKNFLNTKVTFFTTGTVAKEYPELVKRISQDGHEVGSHYNFHDLMYKQSNYEIEKNLEIAKNQIYKATEKEPTGFRAPVFSIGRNRLDIYTSIEKFFEYDSSYVLKLDNKLYSDYLNEPPFNLKTLKEFPIVPKKFLGNYYIKSGGTFLRLFSRKALKKVLEYNVENNFTPIIYLHPYDFMTNKEFWVDKDIFLRKPSLKNFVKYIRQNQWLGLRNKTVEQKLIYIFQSFEPQGCMSNLVNKV